MAGIAGGRSADLSGKSGLIAAYPNIFRAAGTPEIAGVKALEMTFLRKNTVSPKVIQQVAVRYRLWN